MAALAATDVTLTVTKRRLLHGGIAENYVTIAFGNGTLTYPSGGVPLPAYGSWGFKRFMEALLLRDMASANGFVYKYDEANNKLRIYQGDNDNAADAALIELTTAATPAAATLKAIARGW